MNRILKIGMDVHSTNYTLCAMEPAFGAEGKVLATVTVAPDYKNVLTLIETLKFNLNKQDTYEVECGYEAGCFGYSLYNQLTAAGVKCVILAPTTMLTQQRKRVKTDGRDAVNIAKCLSYGTYNSVYIPTEEDNSVKEYLRMRDDHKKALKKVKQQINALCLRHGYHYENTKWTLAHLQWLVKLKLSPLYKETLDEYMATYEELSAKIVRFDERIDEIANQAKYAYKVKKLGCLLGIKTHTAMSLIVETGDFNRFKKGSTYAAYLGLAPGEHSSGEKINRLGITKAGNSHLRFLLVEAASGICKGRIGHKSKELQRRQLGNPIKVITYADRANVRLRSKYYRLIRHGKKRNITVAAIARELACFVWGIMTENVDVKAV